MPLTPTRAAEPLPGKADPIAQVRSLHDLGMAKFEAAEYEQALILWKQAFVLVTHDVGQQSTRAVLVSNMIEAHSRAYEVGRNPEHLLEAMRVIDLRKAELTHFTSEVVRGESQRLDTQRSELARLHELALHNGELPRELPSGTVFRVEQPPPPELTGEQLDKAVHADVELGADYQKAKGMLAGGIALSSIGGGLLAAAIMYGIREPKDGPPDSYVPGAVAFGTGAIVATIIGGTLLGVGSKRIKQAQHHYRERQSPTGTLAPIALPRGGGVGFVGRF